MFHKIRSAAALPGYQLSIQFAEGQTKTYNLNRAFEKWPAFNILKTDPDLYYSLYVDVGGYGIVWNDDLDLACDELWENGSTIDNPFDGLMAFSDATELWGLNESTLRKAIAYGRLINGIDVCKFGKQWVITREAMLREYGVPKETK